jgi:hypothetical protein
MKNENLKRTAEEIKDALDKATRADAAIHDRKDSSIDADTFKQIAQPLRRALRLIERKPTKAEQDADLLFDVMNSGAGGNNGEPVYEFGCELDEAMNAANAIYHHREAFRLLYIAEEVGKDDGIKALVRALRRGVPAADIARQLGEGTFNVKGGARR